MPRSCPARRRRCLRIRAVRSMNRRRSRDRRCDGMLQAQAPLSCRRRRPPSLSRHWRADTERRRVPRRLRRAQDRPHWPLGFAADPTPRLHALNPMSVTPHRSATRLAEMFVWSTWPQLYAAGSHRAIERDAETWRCPSADVRSSIAAQRIAMSRASRTLSTFSQRIVGVMFMRANSHSREALRPATVTTALLFELLLHEKEQNGRFADAQSDVLL